MYELMQKLLDAAESFVKENTKTRAQNITLDMCKSAQLFLEKMRLCVQNGDIVNFNRYMIKLYAAIPRSTENAKIAELLKRRGFLEYTKEGLEERFVWELEFANKVQDAVTAIMQSKANEADTKKLRIDQLCEQNSITVREATSEEQQYVRRLMGLDSNKLLHAWKCENLNTKKRLESYMQKKGIDQTRMLWHGSDTGNFLSILTRGLTLKKASYGMFGQGIYFAKDFDKSRGYCSVQNSRWRGGNDKTAFLALFDVALGNSLHLDAANSSLRKGCYALKGYDSVWAHKGVNLHRDEFITYDDDSCSIAYIVETK